MLENSYLSNLPFSLPFSAGSDLLWYVFFGVLIIFFFYSLFLVYHWFRYGMNIVASLLATVIYGGVSFIILLFMLTSFATLIS